MWIPVYINLVSNKSTQVIMVCGVHEILGYLLQSEISLDFFLHELLSVCDHYGNSPAGLEKYMMRLHKGRGFPDRTVE
jgi:hypothetical protein